MYILRAVPVGVSIMRVERMNEVVYRSACEIEGGNGIEVVDISIPAEEEAIGEIILYSYDASAIDAAVSLEGYYQGDMYWDYDYGCALFYFTDIPSGTYQIQVMQSGYEDFIEDVTVTAEAEFEVEVYLEPVGTTGTADIPQVAK